MAKQEITRKIETEKGAKEFQVRLLKDEGVGLLTTKSEENYLILDSLDYWYDLIQNGYPKKKKCSCKNEWFYVQFNYIPRVYTEDIKEVRMVTTCTACNKISKSISVDIDYGPTNHLVETPITYCEKPNLKYKCTELTSFWSGDDLKNFLRYIFFDLKLNIYCWFSQHPDHTRKFEKITFDKAIQIITVNHRYLNFYFSVNELDTSKYIQSSGDYGVSVKDGIWRRDEIIQLAAPIVMIGYGLLYYLNYCNQYLDKGKAADKSEKFETITNQLKPWLQQNFIVKRGRNCFDGQQAYEKFTKKRDSEKNAG